MFDRMTKLANLLSGKKNRRPSKGTKTSRRHLPFVEHLEDRILLANNFYVVPGTAGTAVQIGFDWVQRNAGYNNEIGVFRVDDANGTVAGIAPGQAGYAQAVTSRTATVFSSGAGTGDHNALTFTAGMRLGFYMVQNSTTGNWINQNPSDSIGHGPVVFFSTSAANPDNFDHVRATAPGTSMTFSFEDQTYGGDRDFNDAIINVNIATPTATPGLTGQTVSTTFALAGRNGAYRGEMGVIVADNASGAIGNLSPGDAGYVAAALAKRNVLFTTGDNPGATKTITLPSNANLVYYLIDNDSSAAFLQKNPTNAANQKPHAFFSITNANPDGQSHVHKTANELAFEDLFGGGDHDFNDVIVRYTYGSPQGSVSKPTISAKLKTDSAGSTGTTTDKITNDQTISATVTDTAGIAKVQVGLDSQTAAQYVDVTSRLGTDGSLTLDSTLLNQIAGGLLQNSQHTVHLLATNKNGATATSDFVFTFDNVTTTPTLLLDSASDTGTVGDFLTSLSAVTINGVVEAGALVKLVGTNQSTTADNTGKYSFVGVALTTGANALTVQSTDIAGNQAQFTKTIDRASQSAAPTITARLSNDTLGSTGTATDKITSDPTVSGSVTDAFGIASLKAGLDSQTTPQYLDITSRLSSSGALTLDAALLNQIFGGTLPNGQHTVHLVATNTNNNSSTFDFTFTLDSTTGTPTLQLAANSDTGVTGDFTTYSSTVSLDGVVEPGATVKLIGTNFTTTADNTGKYSFAALTLSSGVNAFTVQSTDLAGNQSQSTTNVNLVSQTTVPTITAQLSQDTAGSTGTATDKITSIPTISASVTDPTGIFSVQAGLDSQTVAQYLDVTAHRAADGTLTLDSALLNQIAGATLSDGQHTLHLRASNISFIVSTFDFTFTLDTTTATPTLVLNPNSDTGTIGDLITNSASVTLDGVAEAGATLKIIGTNLTTIADNTGKYSFAGVALAEGLNVFSVRSTDLAGNLATSVTTITYIHVPSSPTINAQLANDTAGPTGTATDKITSDPTVAVVVTDPLNGITTVQAGLDGQNIAQYTDVTSHRAANGSLTLDLSLLNQIAGSAIQDGQHVLHLRAINNDGDVTTFDFTFSLDRTTATPTLLLDPNSDTGVVGDLTTYSTSVTLEGVVEAGATVKLVGTNFTTTADNSGKYAFTGVPLLSGANAFTVQSTDLAGNQSQATTSIKLVSQSVTPVITAQLLHDTAGSTGTASDKITSVPTITANVTDLTGIFTVQAGLDSQTVAQYLDVTSHLAVDGTLTLDSTLLNQIFGNTLPDGQHTVHLRATNISFIVSTFDFTLTLDTTTATPTALLDRNYDSGTVGDLITNATSVSLSGVVEAGATVKLVGTNISTLADNTGKYTLTGVPLVAGANALTIQSTDAAGNQSQFVVTITSTDQAPTILSAQSDISLAKSATTTKRAIELAKVFADADMNNSLLRFNTNLGSFDMELFDTSARATVANFMNYVEGGDYSNAIFHRISSGFVLQGGGFKLTGTPPSSALTTIPTDPPIPNEFGISNTLGTVAMAKTSDPNSATDQFFINLEDNASSLNDPNNSGGFTVFGAIVNNGMTVVKQLAAVPTVSKGGAFTQLPLQNFNGTYPGDLTASNLLVINSVDVVRQVEDLTYTATVVSTDNPNLVTLSTDNRLYYTVGANQTGTATITVRATDKAGQFVEDTFTITVT